MARSCARHHEHEELNLNLNPMIDMFAVLIPALLMLSVVLEVAIIHVAAPAIDPVAKGPMPAERPLDFALTVRADGYALETSTGPYAGREPGAPPTIPLVERAVSCSRFRGTWPPPRSKNRDRPPCPPNDPLATRTFWTYDTAALAQRALQLKNAYPTERRIIISGTQEVDFESVVDALDATRDAADADGARQPLFDEVVMRPAVEGEP